MKKSAKIVILLLSVALIVGVLALAVSASVKTKVTYTDADGNPQTVSSIAEAMENVVEGGTVTLESKLTVSASIVISKSVKIDLNGNSIINNSDAPVFSVTAGEDADVEVVGSGYIKTAGSIIDHVTKAEVSFAGGDYGMHFEVPNANAAVISVSDGTLNLTKVEIAVSSSETSAKLIKVTGGELVTDRTGFVCSATDDEAYLFEISGSGYVELNNSYVDTDANVLFVCDGSVGLDKSTAANVGGAEPNSENSQAGSMPELTVRDELVAFTEVRERSFTAKNSSFAQTKSNRVFAAVENVLTSGVSGNVWFEECDIIFTGKLVNTGFGVETAEAALYENFAIVFDGTDIALANYGGIGTSSYLFRGRATAKFINGCTVEAASVPFALSGYEVVSNGATPLVYLEEGTRFDKVIKELEIKTEIPPETEGGEPTKVVNKYILYGTYDDFGLVYDPYGSSRVPFVVMDTYKQAASGSSGYTYRDSYYAEIAPLTDKLTDIVEIDYEQSVRDLYTSGKPSGFGISIENRFSGQLYIESSEANAYFAYHAFAPGDPLTAHSYKANGETIHSNFVTDEVNGTSYYEGETGFMRIEAKDITSDMIAAGTATVVVREFNFAATEAGLATLQYINMCSSSSGSTAYGPNLTVYKNGTTNIGGSVYTDGTWNKMVVVSIVTVNKYNSKLIDLNTTFFINPGTDKVIKRNSTSSSMGTARSELRVNVVAGEANAVPFGAGVRYDDMFCAVYSGVDPNTSHESFLRRGDALLCPDAPKNENIKVNGKAQSDLDSAFEYAAEIGSYVTVTGDLNETYKVSRETADGYMVVKGDYEVLFNADKPAKVTHGNVGDGSSTYYFNKNGVFQGSDVLVGLNWYTGNEENIIDDLDNFLRTNAYVGTYPEVPDVKLDSVIIGDRYFLPDGWVAGEYIWYGKFATAAEYKEAIKSLNKGIKMISYQDLVYGVGPVYYPVYRDAGLPLYIITNPDKLPIGEVGEDIFENYYSRMGSGDTLAFNGNATVSIARPIEISGTVENPAVINIDISGVAVNITADNFITLGDYATVNIYSSVPGGTLTFNGDYLVKVKDGAECATVNIGTYEEYDGRNLTVNTSGLVLAQGAESSTVNIIGGIYNRNSATAQGFINYKNYSGSVTVDGATLISTATNSNFFNSEFDETHTEYTGYDFIVTNSMIIPANTKDTVLSLAKYSNLYIENTAVAGKLGNLTSKVIVGEGTSYMSLSGSNGIVGIAAYSEANINNATRSDRAIVFANSEIRSATSKAVPQMFASFDGVNFDRGIYTTKSADGKTVVIAPAGVDLSAAAADVKLSIPAITNKIVSKDINIVTVRWLTLELDIDKYITEEKYYENADFTYTGKSLQNVALDNAGALIRVHTGGWSVSEELSDTASNLVVMVPEFTVQANISNISTSVNFGESLNINIYFPALYFDYISKEDRANLNHAIKNVAGVDYYYTEALDAVADADIIEALLAKGAVANGEVAGEYLVSGAVMYKLSVAEKALLTPATVTVEGIECISFTSPAEINNAIDGTAVNITVENGEYKVVYPCHISIAGYIKEVVDIEMAKSAQNRDGAVLKLMAYMVDYLDKSYKYYELFGKVDRYGYDFNSLFSGYSSYINAQSDFTKPTFTPSDNSALAGILSVSLDLTSTPRFVFVARDPNFAGTVTVNGVKYTTDDAKVIKGRYYFYFDDFSISDFDSKFTISVDVLGDGSDIREGAYSLGDYAAANENGPAELKALLEAFANYICYARKYAETLVP